MMQHRLQILLDEERYRRLTELAEHRHLSVAAVVREAIDRGLSPAPRRRRAAADRVLAAELMPVGSPADLREELDELRGRHG